MKLFIRTLVFLILMIFLTNTCFAASTVPLQLADSGRTQYVITLASDASVPEKSAASELSSYLKKITGAEFKITTPEQASGKDLIAVGSGAAKKTMPKLTLDKTRLGDDGIVIKTDGSNLILTGAEGSKRGTLYAVYTFLEDTCGVRWWTSKDNYIPSKPNLSIQNQNITYAPVFRYREALYTKLAYAANNETLARFLVQSKFNGHYNKIPAQWGGSYNIIGFCHTSYMLMPPSVYFAQHPEWYSEIKGKRIFTEAQLCMTNEEMIAELTKNVLAEIEKSPDSGIISVTQNDSERNCQCAKCAAMDKAEGSPQGSLLYCINKVAAEVDKKYPGFLVETLAYWYTRKPPKTIRPRDNVLIRLAVIERSGAQPLNDPLNKKLMDDLKKWKAAAPNLFIWDYTANMLSPFTPHPNHSVLAPDARTYATNNVVGVFYEGNHYAGDARGDFDELKNYVMSHMLWNPKQNEKKIITDFLNGYYGKAGPVLKNYLDLLDAKSRKVIIGCCGGEIDAKWMDLDAMNKATKLFDKAEAAVSGNSVILNRVKRARLQLDHQWLRQYNNYKKDAVTAHKLFMGPQDIVSGTETFISNLKSYEDSSIEAEGAGDLRQYSIKLRLRAQTSLKPIDLPVQFANLPADQVVDIQDQDFSLYPGGSIEPDTKASNGFAARMDPGVLSWSVQYKGIGKSLAAGKWHVYASVSCDKVKDKGVAFTGGIYRCSSAKNLVVLTANIEDNNTTVQVDPKIEQEKTATSAKGAGDGEYQLYDMGVHDLSSDDYAWFGTTGGVNPDNVKAICIDRIIFVKEN